MTPREWRTVPQETVLAYVAAECDKAGFIEKILLFGSRARGDERPYSDYDLAVVLAPGTPRLRWVAFAETLDDEAPTLCQLSLVEFTESLRPELLQEISKEGVAIYER